MRDPFQFRQACGNETQFDADESVIGDPIPDVFSNNNFGFGIFSVNKYTRIITPYNDTKCRYVMPEKSDRKYMDRNISYNFMPIARKMFTK